MNNNSFITFILPSLSLGGATKWSITMAEQFAARTASTALVIHAPTNNQRLDGISPSITQIPCAGIAPQNANLKDVITDYLPQYETIPPGIIIPAWAQGTYAASAAIIRKNPEKYRMIAYAHSDEYVYYSTLVYYEPIIHKFVAVSDEIAEKLSKYIPHRKRDILVKPYAVVVPTELKRTYPNPEEPVRLVYAGRLQTRQKNVFDLVKLANILQQKNVHFQLHIVGDGPQKRQLVQRLCRLPSSLQSKIKLVEEVSSPNMANIWSNCDINVMVSSYEGTSISMLESMAHGCVPVVTKVSGTSRVIKQAVTGFCAPVGNLKKMAEFIHKLDNDRSLISSIGGNAHELIKANESFDQHVDWILELRDELFKQPPRTHLPKNKSLQMSKIRRAVSIYADQPGFYWKKLVGSFF